MRCTSPETNTQCPASIEIFNFQRDVYRVEERGEKKDAVVKSYEQTFTVPQFLDVDKISASHRHGMLRLTLPVKESVKPRRLEITAAAENQKQLTAA
jgi:hypothetical protein